MFSYYRKCSLTIECVLLLYNVQYHMPVKLAVRILITDACMHAYIHRGVCVQVQEGLHISDDVTYVYDDVT